MDDQKPETRKKAILRQILHFNIIGVINTGITYLLYTGLVYLGLHYQIALAADYALGIVISYQLNRRITFKAHNRNMVAGFARMVGSYAVLLSLNMGLLWLLVDQLRINKYLAQIFALGVVTVLSFLVQKLFVFKKES